MAFKGSGVRLPSPPPDRQITDARMSVRSLFIRRTRSDDCNLTETYCKCIRRCLVPRRLAVGDRRCIAIRRHLVCRPSGIGGGWPHTARDFDTFRVGCCANIGCLRSVKAVGSSLRCNQYPNRRRDRFHSGLAPDNSARCRPARRSARDCKQPLLDSLRCSHSQGIDPTTRRRRSHRQSGNVGLHDRRHRLAAHKCFHCDHRPDAADNPDGMCSA